MTPQKLEIAILEPDSMFESPKKCSEFSRDQKIEILSALGAAEEVVALQEGMPGQESDLQRRILVALGNPTDAIDIEHTGPSKQHGIARTPAQR
jgi:hypothetical protein